MRKKNYKTHRCFICEREFQSIRYYVSTCSKKCYNYLNSKKYVEHLILGIKIDPHNPPNKVGYRRIMLTKESNENSKRRKY